MAPLSSGGSLFLRRPGENWTVLDEAFLTEATEYEWRLELEGENPAKLQIQFSAMPLLYNATETGVEGRFVTPFQSGETSFQVNDHVFRTYIYPDSRKMTEDQYEMMLSDILEESAACFQLSGLNRDMTAGGFEREISWPQWQYIERNFKALERLFRKIQERPYRKLHRQWEYIRKEKVTQLTPQTEKWFEQSYGKGATQGIPDYVQTNIRKETTDVYENQLLKSQLKDLERMLNLYKHCGYREIEERAVNYQSRVKSWLIKSFLKETGEVQGNREITQVIRKHPVYRQTYQWFERLFKHSSEQIGFDYSIPMKDTYELYEMWCYFQLIEELRKQDMLADTKELFKTKKEGLFLNLSVNHESKVRLINGWKLYFQRNYQANSPDFHTYTHRMIPDIVIEGEDTLYIFDPKYRVPSNLSNALGEMHKYRDGILNRQTGEKAVREVYIMTPWQEGNEEQKFFGKEYLKEYKTGAVAMMPGVSSKWLESWINKTKSK